tara:strand:+ start:16243 stop:17919 length:1677 start_codon:yes stop_codon:yes gene_type:complete
MRNRILQRLENKKRMRHGGMHMYKYNMGGMQQLPGGMAAQIPGTDAVEFIGQSHDDGGIMVDPQTEVEGGETMDQVTMKKGGLKDYFFSDHLKEGGVPYAQLHKNILAMGGTQEDIDYLARMQEKKAGRDPNKVQMAELGGVMQYDEGGPKEGRYPVASYETYGDLEGELGTVADYQPGLVVNGVQMYADKDDKAFRDLIKGQGAGDAWFGNVNAEVLQNAGITSFADMNSKKNVLRYQQEWNKLNPDNKIDEDGLFGEQTFRTAYKPKDDPEPDPVEPEDPGDEPEIDDGSGTDIDPEPVPTKKKKDFLGTAIGLGAMIPAVSAFMDNPDYMESPDLTTPGVVKAERVAKQHLDRVDFNDQIARNANDATAMQKYIETSGGGPASMSNKMAAYAQKQQGDREIKAQEAKANIAIANQEAMMDNKRKVFNSQAALDASKFNVSSQQKAEVENTRNKMYVDEFNRAADAATKDRKLMAVQYGIDTLATLHRDRKMNEAQDNLTAAIDGQRGTMQRFLDAQAGITNNSTTTGTEESTETTTTARRGGYRSMKKKRNKYGK